MSNTIVNYDGSKTGSSQRELSLAHALRLSVKKTCGS
jgi:hypothetical protein